MLYRSCAKFFSYLISNLIKAALLLVLRVWKLACVTVAQVTYPLPEENWNGPCSTARSAPSPAEL